MCGIYCSVRCHRLCKKGEGINSALLQNVSACLKNRGPDVYSECEINIEHKWTAQFAGSVLWMQGSQVTMQPLLDEGQNVLLWNGDIFNGSMEIEENSSDTSWLSQHFSKVPEQRIFEVLSHIRGPYAFIYLDTRNQHLYFGRDRLGRHSLLWSDDGEGGFVLTSVGRKNILNFKEVPAVGIFAMDLSVPDLRNVILHPWSDISSEMLSNTVEECALKIEISSEIIESPLLKVERGRKLDFPLSHNDVVKGTMLFESFMEKCLAQTEVQEPVEKVMLLLRNSVKVRVQTQPGICKTCLCQAVNKNITEKSKEQCSHSKIGVLFSGGLDSTILAILAHEFIPLHEPIDLFNVAFERNKKKETRERHVKKTENPYLVPDRITGMTALEDLRRIFPNRKWNFVQIDVTQEELVREREKVISDLIHPLNTVLDESLGCALWFASRGKGHIAEENIDYSSPARVLLLGMGADELFGGYRRHRTAYSFKGWDGVRIELELDLARISVRNLGRDDRVVSDHGCQGRMPYLDENVVSYISSLEPWERCQPIPSLPPGVGDKLLLRLVAWKLGLRYSAGLPKRAFQFGSRIAIGKEKASDVSERL